jgi:hypothetical protein
MAKILVGIYINQNYNNPDFTIELPDDVIEQIEYMYKRALKKSGMDEDTFGPTYYEQLKKEDADLAGILESAVYNRLYSLLHSESMNDCVQAMNLVDRKDREGNYYQDFALENEVNIDMTDFPRLLGA